MCQDDDRQGGKCVTQIEVTPEMIEAGVAELSEKTLGQPLPIIVREVYLAMASEALYRRSSASNTKRSK